MFLNQIRVCTNPLRYSRSDQNIMRVKAVDNYNMISICNNFNKHKKYIFMEISHNILMINILWLSSLNALQNSEKSIQLYFKGL